LRTEDVGAGAPAPAETIFLHAQSPPYSARLFYTVDPVQPCGIFWP